MTAQILTSDLTTIIQETKRKNPDIRAAAEQSLQDLRALPATSEAQLAAGNINFGTKVATRAHAYEDLRRRPHFINPFLLACKGKQPKAIASAVTCLQRLIVGAGLPKERLQEVLEAFQECVATGLEVQLKILQSLPSLLQTYGDVLEGDLQATVLQLCTVLQQVKNSAVSSTASATLQQTVSSLYERVEAEDDDADEIAPIEGVLVGEETVPVRPAAFDAYRILKDICIAIEGQPTLFMTKASLSSSFGLELIETLLLNHAEIFDHHKEQADLLNTNVMPLVNRCLSERHSFNVTVRAIRVFCILLREHLSIVKIECEIALSLLNHTIETENYHPWRRALCMETFRLMYSNPELLIHVYSTFDLDDNRRNIVSDNLALFVRLASEKPALIGLGQGSTAPTTQSSNATSDEQGVIEAESAAGMIGGGDFGVSEKNVPGISMEWSSMRVPCLDQLDKLDGLAVPETYIYSLVLTCINQLSEVLAKVVLPIAMHQTKARKARSPAARGDLETARNEEDRPSSSQGKQTRQLSVRSHRAKTIPTNPLELEDHPAYSAVKAVADLIGSCWPAVLATSSTFFNAALDAEFYRSLVRSFQKFTQVAGILRLPTPRDALLTALAKVAVPSNLMSSEAVMSPTSGAGTSGANSRVKGFISPMADTFSRTSGSDSPTRSRRSSLEAPGAGLTQRNLMCLRALVHLAIALGPILDKAWAIVLDNVQKAHVLLLASRTAATAHDYKSSQGHTDATGTQSSLSSEIAAVESAISRLFSSTTDYPSDAFKILLTSLCNLIRHDNVMPSTPKPPPSASLAAPPKLQKRIPSVTGLSTSATAQPEFSHFAIAKLGETAKANLVRLAQSPEEGWDLLLLTLNEVITNDAIDDKSRKMAADVLARLTAECCISTIQLDEAARRPIQERCLAALNQETKALSKHESDSVKNVDLEMHLTALEALRTILEHCAESLITGWESIFYIAESVFYKRSKGEGKNNSRRPLSAKLARSAFASIQLICSDFMENLPRKVLPNLSEILTDFGLQKLDMNISLTVVTVFWNVSDFLQKQIDVFDVADAPFESKLDSMPAIWMDLQQRLAQLSRDQRADVRNGSIHIVHRTLDSVGDRLTGEALEKYLLSTLFRTLQIDAQRQLELKDIEESQEALAAFNTTSKIVIQNCARFLTTNILRILKLPTFNTIWQEYLTISATHLASHSYSIDAWIFSALTQILRTSSESVLFPRHAVDKVASLWAREIPLSDKKPQTDAQGQESAHVEYLQCLQAINPLIGGKCDDEQLQLIEDRMAECLSTSVLAPYTSDIDRPTRAQTEILRCYSMLQSDEDRLVTMVVEGLAGIASLPLTVRRPEEGTSLPSFVAVAKQAMDMIEAAVSKHSAASRKPLYGICAAILAQLRQVVEERYTFNPQGSEPKLWQKATSTAYHVLRSVMSAFAIGDQLEEGQKQLWSQITRLVRVLRRAQYDQDFSEDDLELIETIEVETVTSIRTLTSLLLDEHSQLAGIRTKYIDDLFEASRLHASRFDDDEAPVSEVVREQRFEFSEVRLGRTFEPDFDPRLQMCYSSLDELFDIATSTTLKTLTADGEEVVDRRKSLLIQSAFEPLLIRCAIPLKRYIADQPLRGRMPTPMSQRLELLYILGKIQKLQSPDLDEATARRGKAILKRLSVLFVRAKEAARDDKELGDALGSLSKLAVSHFANS